MDEYIKNILNQPEKVEVGQVWSNVDSMRRYLITDVIDENTGVYRAVFLTGVLSLNDGSDVVIEKEKNKFLAKDKLALRITDGPIHKKQLDFCIGKIDEETIEKIKDSLKNQDFNYDDEQDFVISTIIDELHDEHLEALNYYEEALDEIAESDEDNSTDALIINISAYLKKENGTNAAATIKDNELPYFKNRLAADDNSNKEAELHFWQEIKDMPFQNIYKTEKTEIKLMFDVKHNKLLLVAYSSEDININEIKLELKNRIIEAEKVFSDVAARTKILSVVFIFNTELNILKSEGGVLTLTINNDSLQRKILFK